MKHATPITALHSARLIAADLARSSARWLKRRRRDRGRVAAEYNDGDWSAIAREQRWATARSIEDFLVRDPSKQRICRMPDGYVRATNAEYYAYRRETLTAVLKEFAGDAPELVEAGSGYGANLFAIAGAGWPRLRGLDISPVGIETGRKIADRFGLSHITFDRVDLTDAADVASKDLNGRAVFSHYAFEQIPQHTEAALMNLLNAGVARMIHIEPAVELLSWWSPRDWVCGAYIHSMDYQRSLLRTLRRMERAGLIRVVAARRLYYAPTIRHDPSVIVWEPAK